MLESVVGCFTWHMLDSYLVPRSVADNIHKTGHEDSPFMFTLHV
jgi:hypothetical protein